MEDKLYTMYRLLFCMNRILVMLSFVSVVATVSYGQQDAMFTKYMFNSLNFNPGYAGSTDYLSIVALHRDQWYGIDGGPVTQSISAHMPVGDRIGLGLALNNDVIGLTASSTVNLSYAYKIQFGKGTMSMGLQAGVRNFRTDWSRLDFKDARVDDEAYDQDLINSWMPNFGVGLYFYSPKYYIGFSIPHLLEYDLRQTGEGNPDLNQRIARYYRHYFFHAGVAIPIKGNAVVFKPSILFKSVNLFGEFSSKKNLQNNIAAPNELDIDLSLYFYEVFWVGAAFRTSIETFFSESLGGNAHKSSVGSADVWMAFTLKNGVRIGASYDYPLTKISGIAKGSFEVMMGYDFNFQTKNMVTPRYF